MPFRASDVDFKVRDLSPDMSEIVQSSAYLRFLEQSGPGYTLRMNDKVIGCLVFCRTFFQGSYEVVILFSEEAEHYGKTIHKICKNCIANTMKAHGIRRVEARISESAIRNRDWAVAIGMTPEGRCKAFGPDGDDYILYSRVRTLTCLH